MLFGCLVLGMGEFAFEGVVCCEVCCVVVCVGLVGMLWWVV